MEKGQGDYLATYWPGDTILFASSNDVVFEYEVGGKLIRVLDAVDLKESGCGKGQSPSVLRLSTIYKGYMVSMSSFLCTQDGVLRKVVDVTCEFAFRNGDWYVDRVEW